MKPREIQIRPLNEAEIRDMHTWAYPAPYDIYSVQSIPIEEAIAFFLDPKNRYFALLEQEAGFVGFCNFGQDAQVAGGDYSEAAVDIGMGLRPELTGKGRGAGYAHVVFEEASRRFPTQPQRVTIAAFNRRAQRICEKFGFVEAQKMLRAADQIEFVIMMRQVPA